MHTNESEYFSVQPSRAVQPVYEIIKNVQINIQVRLVRYVKMILQSTAYTEKIVESIRY